MSKSTHVEMIVHRGVGKKPIRLDYANSAEALDSVGSIDRMLHAFRRSLVNELD